jgi:hypothetical protein
MFGEPANGGVDVHEGDNQAGNDVLGCAAGHDPHEPQAEYQIAEGSPNVALNQVD